jgi:hypothetical protein
VLASYNPSISSFSFLTFTFTRSTITLKSSTASAKSSQVPPMLPQLMVAWLARFNLSVVTEPASLQENSECRPFFAGRLRLHHTIKCSQILILSIIPCTSGLLASSMLSQTHTLQDFRRSWILTAAGSTFIHFPVYADCKIQKSPVQVAYPGRSSSVLRPFLWGIDSTPPGRTRLRLEQRLLRSINGNGLWWGYC